MDEKHVMKLPRDVKPGDRFLATLGPYDNINVRERLYEVVRNTKSRFGLQTVYRFGIRRADGTPLNAAQGEPSSVTYAPRYKIRIESEGSE